MVLKQNLIDSIKSALDILKTLNEIQELNLVTHQKIEQAKKHLYNGLNGKQCDCHGTKRKPSNFNNFVQWKTEQLRRDQKIPADARFKLASQQWRALSKEEKAKFNDMSKIDDKKREREESEKDAETESDREVRYKESRENEKDGKKRKKAKVVKQKLTNEEKVEINNTKEKEPITNKARTPELDKEPKQEKAVSDPHSKKVVEMNGDINYDDDDDENIKDLSTEPLFVKDDEVDE